MFRHSSRGPNTIGMQSLLIKPKPFVSLKDEAS